MQKTVYELVEEYVNETAPNATPEEKEKMIDANVIALLRV